MNLLKRYAAERTVSSLLPRRGNLRAKRVNESVGALIAATLRKEWLVEEAPPLTPVVEDMGHDIKPVHSQSQFSAEMDKPRINAKIVDSHRSLRSDC